MEHDEKEVGDLATRFSTEDNKYNVQTIQDTDPTAQLADFERKTGANGWTDGRRMRKRGTIPSVFLMQDKYRDIMDGDQKAMEKAVNRFFFDHPEFKTDNDSTKYF